MGFSYLWLSIYPQQLLEVTRRSVVSSASGGPCSVSPGARGEGSHKEKAGRTSATEHCYAFCKHVTGMMAKPTLQRRKIY